MNVMGKMPGSITFFKCVFLEHPKKKSATGQFGVYAKNDEHRIIGRAQSPKWCMGLYQLGEIRWSDCG